MIRRHSSIIGEPEYEWHLVGLYRAKFWEREREKKKQTWTQ